MKSIIKCTVLVSFFCVLRSFSISQSFTVGQKYQGGIIFYLDTVRNFGLIAAEKDINPEIPNIGALPYCIFPFGTFIGACNIKVKTDTIIGSGKQNCINLLERDSILVLRRALPVNQTDSVNILNSVRVCDTVTIDGYTDWYLPSKDELKLMYNLRSVIGNFATNQNGGTVYGSSSEVDSGTVFGGFVVPQKCFFSWNIQFNYLPGSTLIPFERADVNGYVHIVRPIRTFTINSTLSVFYQSFKAERKGNDILLHWQTANEINSDYFNVQHSTNGNTWQNTGKVNAGNGTYSFLHTTPAIGNNFYRLQQIDKDGKTSLSSIQQINLSYSHLKEIGIYPNPGNNKFIILDVPFFTNGKLQYFISDVSGKLFQQGQIANQKNLIDVSLLPNSPYIIKLSNGISIKFMKL